MRLALVSGVLLVLLCLSALAADPELDAAFGQSSVVITASSSACYRFRVFVALDNRQWRRGLMHVRFLDAWRGMLFVYGNEAPRSMWMKNTFLPLDMLFIKADGTISSVVENTEPQSLQSISSIEDVRYVLELNAGTTARLKIAAGDTLFWAGDVSPPLQD